MKARGKYVQVMTKYDDELVQEHSKNDLGWPARLPFALQITDVVSIYIFVERPHSASLI